MPWRPSMSRLLAATRERAELDATHSVDRAVRASVQEARARARLYPASSFAAVFNNRRGK